MRFTAQVQHLRAAVASTLAREVAARSSRGAAPVPPTAPPLIRPATGEVLPIRIISGWVERLFWLAIVLSAVTLVVLVVAYGSGQPQLTTLERSGWLAAPFGFGFFVLVAKWRVPAALASIRERRLLGDDDNAYLDAFRQFQSRLNSPWSILALGVSAVVLSGYVLTVPNLLGEGTRSDGRLTGAEVLEVTVATVIAGIAGLGLWRMYAIGRFVSDLGKHPDLRVQLHHPDGCGGLAPLGRICLDNVLVLAVPAVMLAYWVVQGAMGYPSPVPVHMALLLTVILTASLAFVLPMLSIRRAMKSKAAEVLASLERQSEAIDALAEDIVKGDPSRPVKKLRKRAKELELRRQVYQRESQVPTWPIRFRGVVTFVASQAIPILALLVSFAQLIS